jgi:hypothetical protein
VYRSFLAARALQNHWQYLDVWDLVPMQQFTNTPVHLTPSGESLLAEKLTAQIQIHCK